MSEAHKVIASIRISDLEQFKSLVAALEVWAIEALKSPVKSQAEVDLISALQRFADAEFEDVENDNQHR